MRKGGYLTILKKMTSLDSPFSWCIRFFHPTLQSRDIERDANLFGST